MLKYSIIICTYNRDYYLQATIESVINAINNRDDCELLLIDNNSSDLTKEIIEQFVHNAKCRYFFELEQGLSHARNRGLKESTGELLIYLDDDIELPLNYFDVCDDIYNNPEISISGGKVLPHRADIPIWLPEKYFYLVSIYDLGDKEKFVKYLMGGNFAIRKKVAEKIGYYNTLLGRNGKILSGGEEIDYQNRAMSLGFKMFYHPKQLIFHKINEKLNENYILNYALELGKSERLIDESQSRIKVFTKILKSIIALMLNYLLGFFIVNRRLRMYFKIIGQFGRGYLRFL